MSATIPPASAEKSSRRLLRRGRVQGAVAGAIGMAVLGGGVAFAAIPSANGTINACVAGSGALRVIDTAQGQKCSSDEKPLSWNRMKQRGAWSASSSYVGGDVVTRNGSSYVAKAASTGKDPATATSAWGLLAAKGAKGDKGDAGTPGSAVQILTLRSQKNLPAGQSTVMKSFQLPAGTYEVVGSLKISSTSTSFVDVYCGFGEGLDNVSATGRTQPVLAGQIETYENVAITTVITVPALTPYDLTCGRSAGNNYVSATFSLHFRPIGGAAEVPVPTL